MQFSNTFGFQVTKREQVTFQTNSNEMPILAQNVNKCDSISVTLLFTITQI